MQYRAEIDGLRAIAVSVVVLFHAGLETFSGGFIGVDVFFVISGYLIATIIISEAQEERFSFMVFYERRARRLMPALFLVLWFSLLASVVIYSPADLREFGRSAFATVWFFANFYSWREQNYFAVESELAPLLHMWSLAVEEQYYLLFPPVLLILVRLGVKVLFAAVVAGLVLSFIAALILIDISEAATFYMLPTRAWELLAGVLCALTLIHKGHYKSQFLNQVMSFSGLCLITYSTFVLSGDTPTPGLTTILPVLGAALIIVFAVKDTLVNRLLTFTPAVSLGLISYSFYLWHQPIFAFAKYLGVQIEGSASIVPLILLAMILAWLSWRYVENRFRGRGGKVGQNKVFGYSLLLALITSAASLTLVYSDGLPNRFSLNQQAVFDFQNYDRSKIYREEKCFLMLDQSPQDFDLSCSENDSFYVWGDSHAAALSWGINLMSPITQLTAAGCPPIIDAVISGRPHCEAVNQFIFEEIKREKPRLLIMHANWFELSPETRSLLGQTLRKIERNSPETSVMLIGSVPQWPRGLPSILAASGFEVEDFNATTSLKNSMLENTASVDAKLKAVVKNIDSKSIVFVSLLDKFCSDSHCLTSSNDGIVEPFSWDRAHLTASGSVMAAKFLSPTIKKFTIEREVRQEER
jgi:peptidoglycan/LPS O-acetylase OafA/YrhL